MGLLTNFLTNPGYGTKNSKSSIELHLLSIEFSHEIEDDSQKLEPYRLTTGSFSKDFFSQGAVN